MPFRPLSTLSRRQGWRAWLVLAACVFTLALAVRAVPALRARDGLPTKEAQWIWKVIDRKDHDPIAFYAIRDFDLESPPGKARLLITADEEYVALLNGKRVAAGTFAGGSGTQLDTYEVGPLLLRGGNRLIIELRSGRGAGGLLATLEDEATRRPIVVSDESWRIFPRHELGLVRGWLSIDRREDGEPAFCWGYPPIGRWGRPRVGRPEPLLPTAPLVPAASARPLSGSIMLYDWEREVEGYLTLDVPPADKPGVGLLYAGAEPLNPRRAPLTAPVLILPGRHDWMDTRPRRFRYAVVVGLARPATAAVLPAPVRPALPRDPDEMKVFGIEGPPLRTPVEDEVWSKLQSLPGVARRKDL
ncbi:MAG TPA: hypothetical protein VHC97_24235 [Thermoanaerobaculia bacterium]|nr:hypothetical protein [Thermoanaerobaculia bacterium]